MMNALQLPNSDLDTTAILQRIQGSILAYTIVPEELEAFMEANGGGTRIEHHLDPVDVLYPSWWSWEQGQAMYFHVGGTDILGSYGAHLVGDVAGTFLSINGPQEGVFWHQFFEGAARQIFDILRDRFRATIANRWTSLHFSGHSYGGASAQIAGYLWKQYRPDMFVDVLAFGSPKPVYQFADGIRLNNCYCIAHPADPVPFVPFESGLMEWSARPSGRNRITGEIGREWMQIGRPSKIDGLVLTELQRADPFWRYPSFSQSIGNHLGTAYRDAIRDCRRRQLGIVEPDAFEEWLYGGPNPPPPVDPGLPPGERIQIHPRQAYVNVLGYQEDEVPLLPEAQSDIITMTVNSEVSRNDSMHYMALLRGSSMLYKFTFMLSDATYGCSTSLFLKTPGTMTSNELRSVAARFLSKHAKILSNKGASQSADPSAGTPMCVGYRTSVYGAANQSFIEVGPFGLPYSPNPWTTQTGSQQFNSGLNCRLKSAYSAPAAPPQFPDPRNLISYTNLWLPSPPDEIIANNAYLPQGNSSGGQTFAQRLAQFMAYLFGGQGDIWGHLGIDPNTPVKVLKTASTVEVGGHTVWQFTASDVVGWAEGDLIQISRANARGWNGIYRVITIAGNLVTISGGPSTLQPGFTSAKGRLNRKSNGQQNLVFFQFNELHVVKPAVRKAAKPFNPVSFRRRQQKQKTSR